MQEKSIILNNLRINYLQSDNFNSCEAVVLVHGWGSRASHLYNIYNSLNSFVALDLPGFGGSEAPKDIWGVDEYYFLFQKFVEKLKIKNPILVGHSFGGSLIIKYIANGGKAKKVILIGSAGIRRRSVKVKLLNFFSSIFKAFLYFPGIHLFRDQIRKYFYKAIDSEDYINAGQLTESYKKIISQDLTKEMEMIKIPTILIWGENDKSTSVEDAQKINSLIKDSKLNIIKGAGHFVFIDQVEEFKKVFQNSI